MSQTRVLWAPLAICVLLCATCSSLPPTPTQRALSQGNPGRTSASSSQRSPPQHPGGYHGWLGREAIQAGADPETARIAQRIMRGEIDPVPFDREDGVVTSISGTQPTVLQLVGRALYLLYVFSPMIVTALLALFVGGFRSPYWYRTIACGVSSSGAAFIKWGQWASTRPDMFPEDLCSTLSMLHSYAPVHSFEYTRKEVEKALGQRIEDVFDSFDPEPIASGSIAQVHKAMLRGRKVAIKVRHPGVAEQIEVDFRLMKMLANFLDSIPAFKFLHLRQSMDQFSHTLASQTRLDVEGAHLLLLNRNFKRFKNVNFPHPLFLSEAVLIESFEEGVIISDYIARYSQWKEQRECQVCHEWAGGYVHLHDFIRDGIQQMCSDVVSTAQRVIGRKGNGQANRRRKRKTSKRPPLTYELAHFIVATGEDLYLKMLLVDNLMHADLHPGNILIHTGQGPPKLTLVDAGMVARLTDEERENFIGLLEALGAGDGRRAARHVLGFSKEQMCHGQAAEGFIDSVEAVFKQKCRGYETGVDVGEVLRSVLRLVRDYQVRVDVNYATLLINLLCLEGIAGALDETYNVLDRAKPLLKPHSNRLVRPFFKSVFPALLTVKKFHDALLYRIVKTAKKLEAPPPITDDEW